MTNAALSCEELRPLAEPFADGELADDLRARAEAHRSGCPDCDARLARAGREASALGAATAVAVAAPAGLAASILDAIDAAAVGAAVAPDERRASPDPDEEAAAPPATRSPNAAPWVATIVAVGAGLVLGGFLLGGGDERAPRPSGLRPAVREGAPADPGAAGASEAPRPTSGAPAALDPPAPVDPAAPVDAGDAGSGAATPGGPWLPTGPGAVEAGRFDPNGPYPWAEPAVIAGRDELIRRLASRQASVNFPDTPLADVVGFLNDITGDQFVLSEAIAGAGLRVSLRTRDMVLHDLIGLIAAQLGIRSEVLTDRVVFLERGESIPGATAKDTAILEARSVIERAIDRQLVIPIEAIPDHVFQRRVDVHWSEETVTAAIDQLRDQTGLSFVLTTAARQIADTAHVSLTATQALVPDVLDVLADLGLVARWRDGAWRLISHEEAETERRAREKKQAELARLASVLAGTVVETELRRGGVRVLARTLERTRGLRVLLDEGAWRTRAPVTVMAAEGLPLDVVAAALRVQTGVDIAIETDAERRDVIVLAGGLTGGGSDEQARHEARASEPTPINDAIRRRRDRVLVKLRAAVAEVDAILEAQLDGESNAYLHDERRWNERRYDANFLGQALAMLRSRLTSAREIAEGRVEVEDTRAVVVQVAERIREVGMRLPPIAERQRRLNVEIEAIIEASGGQPDGERYEELMTALRDTKLEEARVDSELRMLGERARELCAPSTVEEVLAEAPIDHRAEARRTLEAIEGGADLLTIWPGLRDDPYLRPLLETD